MSTAKIISQNRPWLAALPLAVAYAALPLGSGLSRLQGVYPTVPPDLIWLCLAGIGLLLALRRSAPGAPVRRGFVFRLILFLLMIVGLVLYLPEFLAGWRFAIPYLKECAPLAYLLLGVLWAATCGLPDRDDFQRYGALLGGLCLLDLAVEVVMFRAVPTVRLIGNVDVLAGLLLLSLCAGLRPGNNQGGAFEPDQGRPWWRALIMLGLVACLSRTGLFGAGWVILCFGRGRLRMRVLFAVLCMILLVGSFLLPATISDAIRYADYWLWVEAVRLFSDTPGLLLTGFPVGDPLPVRFPVGMSAVWEVATGASATFGAFLAQVPSFWLRFTLAWGLLPPILLLLVMFTLLLRHLTRMGAGLTAVLFAQGMTTPLFFDPATGVCVSLAFVLALTPVLCPVNERREDVPVPPEVPGEHAPDPVEEWSMRSL